MLIKKYLNLIIGMLIIIMAPILGYEFHNLILRLYGEISGKISVTMLTISPVISFYIIGIVFIALQFKSK